MNSHNLYPTYIYSILTLLDKFDNNCLYLSTETLCTRRQRSNDDWKHLKTSAEKLISDWSHGWQRLAKRVSDAPVHTTFFNILNQSRLPQI